MEKGEEFFTKVLESLDAKPEECVMVGDREDHDILPAKALGIKTVRMFSGKHASQNTEADFSIKDVGELLSILQRL